MAFLREAPPTFDAETMRALAASAWVTPEDILRARLRWRQSAMTRYRPLLDARPVKDDVLPEPAKDPTGVTVVVLAFRWDPARARFLDRSGRVIPPAEIRRALDRALAAEQRAVEQLAKQIRERALSLAAWELQMRDTIKGVHLYSAAAANGGWKEVTASDVERVSRTVDEEYRYLHRFARELADGSAPPDGRLARRAALYTEAARPTYHAFEQQVMREHQMTEERSILGEADHCTGCIVQARRGWVPLGELVPIGFRDCGPFCRCRIEYR